MDPLLILLFVFLFSLSAFFSGTELALMSLASHKIDSLVKEGRFGSKSLKNIKKNNDKLLITILIGNNLVNTLTASFATTIAIEFARTSGATLNEATAVGISTGIITFLLLLFGEIIPKSIAIKNATSIALSVAPIYKFLLFILYPLILIIGFIVKLFSKGSHVETMSDEEIESFIDMGRDKGGIDDDEHEKIKSILEFDDTTVEEVMTPRVKIDALDIDTTVSEAMDFYLSHTHSRIPVFTDTIDKIDYYLTGRDLIRELNYGNKDKKLSEIKLKKVLKVPLTQSIQKLFETLQGAHRTMSIIMDEYGGVSGLVTMEDIIEQVFGEIRDETDKESEEFIKNGKNSFIVSSDVLIEEVLYKFDLELSDIGLDERDFDGETLSYVITHILEGFPSNGEIINFNINKEEENNNKKEKEIEILSLKIIDIDNAKIGKVDVTITKKEILD
ncbi:MAG: hemolysin family protein [Candidatus Gracilibacteria bacterium]|nr:hemolysin family protein [Candidatus Gracilibacteria bacterium]